MRLLPPHRLAKTLAVIALAGVALAGCKETDYSRRALQPLSSEAKARLAQLGMSARSPMFVRIFKEESKLEIWKPTASGRYALFKSYDICKWSGGLGPKVREGDRQAPEGFYTVTPASMNPNSSYYLSFNIGYPNAYDRSLGRTGSHLMVHGACSSAGCYAMTDEQMAEIFALARESFLGGQRDFQVHAFPFRMTPENMAAHRGDPNMPFWKMLKVGYDHFEVTRRPPKVDVCDRRYVFDADFGGFAPDPSAPCPAYQVPPQIALAVAEKQRADEDKMIRIAAALDRQEERRRRFENGDTAVAGVFRALTGRPEPAARTSLAPVPEPRPDLIVRKLDGTIISAPPPKTISVPAPQVASRPPVDAAAGEPKRRWWDIRRLIGFGRSQDTARSGTL